MLGEWRLSDIFRECARTALRAALASLYVPSFQAVCSWGGEQPPADRGRPPPKQRPGTLTARLLKMRGPKLSTAPCNTTCCVAPVAGPLPALGNWGGGDAKALVL